MQRDESPVRKAIGRPVSPPRSSHSGAPDIDVDALQMAGDVDRERYERAWADAYRQLQPWLAGVLRRHGVRDHEMEDALATVWLQVFQRMSTLRSSDRLRSWLARVAERVALMRGRAGARAMLRDAGAKDVDLDAVEDTDHQNILDVLEYREQWSTMRAKIATFDEASQHLYRLCFEEACGDHEAAAALGTTRANLRQRRRTLIKKLRELLSPP